MNARTRGPLAPPPSLLSDERATNLQLARALRPESQTCARLGLIDPLSFRVLQALHIEAFVPVYFLAVTRARWNELADVEPVRALKAGRIKIAASKGSADRFARVRAAALSDRIERIRDGVAMTVISYDAVNRHIRRAQAAASLRVPARHNSGTHVFRHYWASWRASQGASLDAIASDLGHHNTASTLCYIHDSIELVRP